MANPNQTPDRFGLPADSQLCVDGDPSCDFKANQPGVCAFQVALCLNNPDPNLPRCVPNGVSSVLVLSPQPARARAPELRAALAAYLAAVQNAVQHLLDPNNPFAGYTHAPPLNAAQQGFCSAPFLIDVPVAVSGNRRNRRSVRLATRSADDSFPAARVQLSRLQLTCASLP